MIVTAIKTEKVLPKSIDLFQFLDKYLKSLNEGSILAIASKVVALSEGRAIPVDKGNKDELIMQEADLYLPKEENSYNLFLTITKNILAVSGGIDESNTNGYYLLWPEDSQKTANEVREYLVKRFGLKNVGVIITDSKTTPLRWGVTGIPIAHSGFAAVRDLIGTPDIFGRKLKMTKIAVSDALAVAAVLVGGEGDEQTPLSIISEIPFVEFQDRNPTEKELSELKIDIKDDVYAPLLKSVSWEKGKR